MQLLSSTGTHATGAKRGKTCIPCEASENNNLLHVTCAKRAKTTCACAKREKTTCNLCKARENNMRPVQSAAKQHATCTKCGKTTCNLCKLRENNMQPVPSKANKQVKSNNRSTTQEKIRKGVKPH